MIHAIFDSHVTWPEVGMAAVLLVALCVVAFCIMFLIAEVL